MPTRSISNPESQNPTRGLVSIDKFAHVAARNAEDARHFSLPDTGGFQVCAEIGHTLEVGTLRTSMQEKVRYGRLASQYENWHDANMGLRIRILRKELGLTGEQLADIVGVTKGYISEIETGKKTPGAALLIRFAAALKKEVYELFDGSEDERRSASLKAHMEVMEQLPDVERQAIEKAAQGLLAKQS